MKQFSKILKFELKNLFTNKIFIGVTVFIMAALCIVMFFPRLSESILPDKTESEDKPVMLIGGTCADFTYDIFAGAFPGYTTVKTSESEDEIKNRIENESADCAFITDELTSYKYIVKNLSMYDNNTMTADIVLSGAYRMNALISSGLSPEEAAEVINMPVEHETLNLGKDQSQNFFYTYIMIFALYMVILLYGQMVATSVATEKSSRAMELLITTADPVSMMFGKVLASCTAGLTQLTLIFGSSILFYKLNSEYLEGNMIIDSLFNMPVSLFLYMLLFFVLGFLIFAFLFGAVGSTVSKLEDINTAVMPVTLLFIAGFMVVVFSMSGGNIDSMLMKVCSYVPFTSPMAMFTRIAMSTVRPAEIIISVLILIISVAGTGYISAKIYRTGVLLYGTPPKISAIIKAIKHN